MSRKKGTKIIDIHGKLRKALNATQLDEREFAIKAGIGHDTLQKAVQRESFSREIVEKLYDKHGIRKEFWADGGDVFDNTKPKKEEENVSQIRLIASLERLAMICETDNRELWGQNKMLLALVEKLALATGSGAN